MKAGGVATSKEHPQLDQEAHQPQSEVARGTNKGESFVDPKLRVLMKFSHAPYSPLRVAGALGICRKSAAPRL